jgi:hypothetical protein
MSACNRDTRVLCENMREACNEANSLKKGFHVVVTYRGLDDADGSVQGVAWRHVAGRKRPAVWVVRCPFCGVGIQP